MSDKRLSDYAPELYEALKNLLGEIPVIAGDNRHDALGMRIFEASKLIREIDAPEYTDGLKPCPFCGSHNVDVRQEFSSSPWEAVCDDCGASLYRDTMQEAIKAWNRRHRNDTQTLSRLWR